MAELVGSEVEGAMIVDKPEAMHEQIEKYGRPTGLRCSACSRRRETEPDHTVHWLFMLEVEPPESGKPGVRFYACTFCDAQEDQRH